MPVDAIPPLPDFAAEIVAREAAPDVQRLHVAEWHGDYFAKHVPTRKPSQPGELDTLERVRRRATEKGWAWADVLERVREQLGLTADFLPAGSHEQTILDGVRERQALREARDATKREFMLRRNAKLRELHPDERLPGDVICETARRPGERLAFRCANGSRFVVLQDTTDEGWERYCTGLVHA